MLISLIERVVMGSMSKKKSLLANSSCQTEMTSLAFCSLVTTTYSSMSSSGITTQAGTLSLVAGEPMKNLQINHELLL